MNILLFNSYLSVSLEIFADNSQRRSKFLWYETFMQSSLTAGS